jgi:hypothetical protein
MADLLDGLEALVHSVDDSARQSRAVARRSESNRLSLLHIHAAAALIIAPLFALLGREGMQGPSWTVVRLIPAAPYSLAVLLAVGGVVLGVATWHRHKPAEMLGLWLLLSWYVTISVSFAGAALLWLVDSDHTGPKPSFYPPAVYLHLSVIMAVHLRTLRRMRRGDQ